jgi:hypothetical protein
MSLEQLTRHARLYARSLALIGEIRVRARIRKLLLGVFAVGMAIFGLGMLNLGLYHALTSIWGEIWTPLIIGLGDLVIAGLAILAGAAMKHGPELRIAEELRDSLADDISADLQSLRSLQGLASLLGGPADTSTARLLIPVVGIIIGALRKRRSTAAK